MRVQLPDVEHWKAQVKCQAGCPVATDAGRYVQLDRRGARRGGVPRRARAEPVRLGLRPRLRGAVRGRLPARRHRRADLDPRAQALRHRALRRRVDPPRHAGPPARRAGRRGQPLRGPPAGRRLAPPTERRAGATQGGRRRRRSGRASSAAHDLALLGYDVTVFDGAEEPGGMMRFGIPEYRLPRTPDPRRDRQDPRARRDARARSARSTPSFGLAELRRDGFEAVFLSVGVSKGRDLAGPGRRARRRRQGRRLPAQRQPRLPDGPRPPRRRDRRRLRGVRRRAHGAAARPRGRAAHRRDSPPRPRRASRRRSTRRAPRSAAARPR